MSDDWKKDRAEMSIKEYELKKLLESKEKFKKQEDKKWEDLKTSLYVGDRNHDDYVDSIINSLREKYQLPIKK